ELLTSPGIGRYTAGAIASFAFEQPVAIVDTNVRRVLARVFIGPVVANAKQAQQLADAALPREAAYAWNQALMDIGATICRIDQPLCLVCPLLTDCHARALPAVEPPARRGRASVPFERSDRYLRGRIVDAVRALIP